jgi:IS30 family transposase
MDRDSLERFLATGLSLEQIGKRVGRHPSTVGYWLKKHGLKAVNHDRNAPKGGIDSDRLADCVARDLTLKENAVELGVGVRTVSYRLERHGIVREVTMERRARKAGRLARGRLKRCPSHGDLMFTLDSRGYYRCPQCAQERVIAWRRRTKIQLVAEAGGACIACGYSRSLRALHFHHLDPAKKEVGVAAKGGCRSIERLREEVRKCVLLCSNCHAEVEHGELNVDDLSPGRSALCRLVLK